MKFALYCCSVFLLLSPALQAAQPIKICYESPDDTSTLLSYRIGYEEVFGMHAAVVVDALQTLQQPYALYQLPWRRCLAATVKGEMDAVIGIGWTSERSKQLYFPYHNNAPDQNKRITSLRYYIYSSTNSKLNWDGQLFQHVHHGIAAPSGYIAEQMLAELGVLQRLNSTIGSGLDLVINNRLDGYVLAKDIAEQQLKHHPAAEQIRRLEPEFLEQALYMAFSQQARHLTTQQRLAIWSQLERSRLTLSDRFND